MKKVINGLQWYKNVYNFLASRKCYLVITENEQQKQSIITLLNRNKGEGIRLKAEIKKYGLYISRGRRGNAAVVSEKIMLLFCDTNGLNLARQMEKQKIILYNEKLFKECHQLKNISVHKGKSIPQNIKYHKQLETEEWQKFRKVIFAKRGKVCEMCGSTKILQVHHLRYIQGHKAWEYPPEDVMVLCKECHQKVHGLL